MSAATTGQQGLAALDKRDWATAISKLTKAIESSPSPKWLIARSKALVGTSQFPEAFADAELAYHLALDRGNRDLMMEAQYRRAVVLFRLKKYADADVCLAWVMAACLGGRLADAEKLALDGVVDAEGRYNVSKEEVQALLSEKLEGAEGQSTDPAAKLSNLKDSANSKFRRMAGTLRLSVLHGMHASPEDDPGRRLTISIVPPKVDRAAKLRDAKSSAPATAAATTAAPKPLRIDAYESDKVQTVSLFTKNTDAQEFKLEWLGESSLSVGPFPDEPTGTVTLELGGAADAVGTTFSVRPTKVELRIAKAAPGKWNTPKLHYPNAAPQTQSGKAVAPPPPASDEKKAPSLPKGKAPESAPILPKAQTTTVRDVPPSYPTSSRTGPKNWEAIVGDDDDDDADAGDPNAWFKKLYAGGTDEQRRAMMKSFTESNGTALSTDWSDVGGRKVETKPPDGVEAREWE
ncbi:related to SGT1 protein [Cephalotrichum gorgonifer]|uniref:Related to SGT1 protein n=1 Tax=Cephalotrichum gorgonifer TaxID=2041049 RepID=A0AAE8N4U3_9PEZI|nr:related to SGT1 protein [Cephalotrichum gorgonifer]